MENIQVNRRFVTDDLFRTADIELISGVLLLLEYRVCIPDHIRGLSIGRAPIR